MNIVGLVLSYLTMIFFYGVMLTVILMMRKVSKDMVDVKQSILDLQQTITLMQLPREKDRDKAERLE
jgi:hypothetical protein